MRVTGIEEEKACHGQNAHRIVCTPLWILRDIPDGTRQNGHGDCLPGCAEEEQLATAEPFDRPDRNKGCNKVLQAIDAADKQRCVPIQADRVFKNV